MPGAVAPQGLAGLGLVLGQREQHVLGGDVLVVELAGLALGGAQDVDQLAAVLGSSVPPVIVGSRRARR